MSELRFAGRAGLQQRVMPFYRAPLFDLVGQRCENRLSVFAGDPRPEEKIETTEVLQHARFVKAENYHFFSGSLYLCWQRNLMSWLTDWQPDTLILEANPRYLSSSAAIRWMRRRHKPVIGWGLGAPIRAGFLSSLRDERRKQFLRQFDTLIAYSQKGAEEYQKIGFPQENIFIAPNAAAIAPSNLPPDRSTRQGHATILFVGRLQERKRVDLLIQACANLPAAIQPVLVIVGDGPDRSRLEKLASSIYPETRFTGHLVGIALDTWFNQADLFVLPGTGGLAVQQAMSFGLPVVVAEGDGTQSDLVRAGNGWQIQPGSLDELRATLQGALIDRAILNKMGEESYRIVKEEVNLVRMADIFVQALRVGNRT
jgi:glycosyltransferase involved in cell wall biosynthesis